MNFTVDENVRSSTNIELCEIIELMAQKLKEDEERIAQLEIYINSFLGKY